MKSNSFQKSEVLSGLFVFGCILTLFVLLFFSSSSQLFQDSYPFNIRFHYISGLEVNAPVHLAGHEIGKVTDIKFSIEKEEPIVEVTVSVKKDAVIRTDADAFINVMGFMGETYIELSPGTSKAQALKPSEVLQGTDPIPMMELVKKGTQIIEEFEKSSVAMNNLLGQLTQIVGENQDAMNHIFTNLDTSSENLAYMTSDLKSHPWKLLKKGEESKEAN